MSTEDKLKTVSPTFGNTVLPAVVGSKTKYQIVYADPAWSYPESGSKAKVHDRHYKCMSLDEICNLPIKDITDDNCLLFLWVTMPRLFDAKKVIDSWGFQYKTVAFNWVKENKRAVNKSLFDETPIDDFLGLGSWTRSNSEICLLAVKGKPKKQSSSVRQLVVTPIEKHSKKPDCVRDMILELCGDLPRIELFARQNVNGWDAWGNEVAESVNLEISANNGR